MFLIAWAFPPNTSESVKRGSGSPRGAGNGSGFIRCSLLSWSISLYAASSEGWLTRNVVGSGVGSGCEKTGPPSDLAAGPLGPPVRLPPAILESSFELFWIEYHAD